MTGKFWVSVREPVEANIIFPDQRQLRIPVPRWAAQGFLRRLSIAEKNRQTDY
ncbi:MAG: hypothetical protein R2941_04870 [Desulfobacterales bacterium]